MQLEQLEQFSKSAGKSRSRKTFNYYPALILLLGVVLATLVYFYYVINRPPTLVDKKTQLGYQQLFSIYGYRADRLSGPTEVACDSDQNIYVADTNNHRVMVFDSNGDYVTQFGDAGDGAGQLLFPSGITVDSKKNVYVLSRTQNKMLIYNSKHKLAWEVGVQSPLSITAHKDRIYLTTDRGVMIGNSKGQLLSQFGSRGETKGNVNCPTGIAVDDNNRIYVADSLNYRVQAFNANGQSLWTIGNRPKLTKNGELRDQSRRYGLPAGLALGDDGNLLMVDAQVGDIYVINTDGKEVDKFGDWGHDDGQFYYPAGIAFMGDGKYVVADRYNDRVQVIRYQTQPPLSDRVPGGLPILLILILIGLTTAVLGGRWIWQNSLLKKRQQELNETVLG
jgi:DNA-binding beta-propeller fold protein YncE